MIKLGHVDNGKSFDFGKTSADYAKYRDIYPESFYQSLIKFGVGTAGQRVLDLGTGSGVIPRNMLRFGARFVGGDIAQAQIEQAKSLSEGMDIEYIVCTAEETGQPDSSFDTVTAAQCFWYFDIPRAIPELHRILKPHGGFARLSMIALPRESKIAAKSEELVKQFNPDWSGDNFDRVKLAAPDWLGDMFYVETLHTYVEALDFTRETWCGRMRACRGIGASLPPDLVAAYDKAHYDALGEIAGEHFQIPHQVIIEVYRSLKR